MWTLYSVTHWQQNMPTPPSPSSPLHSYWPLHSLRASRRSRQLVPRTWQLQAWLWTGQLLWVRHSARTHTNLCCRGEPHLDTVTCWHIHDFVHTHMYCIFNYGVVCLGLYCSHHWMSGLAWEYSTIVQCGLSQVDPLLLMLKAAVYVSTPWSSIHAQLC